MTWRRATRNEIYEYYTEVFPTFLEQLPSFITENAPKQYAIAFREPYPVRADEIPPKSFIRRDTRQTDATGSPVNSVFCEFSDVVEFIQHPAMNDPLGNSRYALAGPDAVEPRRPHPDAVYYALDNWERPWVLFLDIDAKMVAQERAQRILEDRGSVHDPESVLEAAGVVNAAPNGYPYAYCDIDRAIEYGFELRGILRDDFAVEETMVVYSGQGVHVYALDDDPAHRYDAKSREVLNDLLIGTYDIPIDPVVTADKRRVARLPYSLHADVCAIVQPIESSNFDVRSATPEFIVS